MILTPKNKPLNGDGSAPHWEAPSWPQARAQGEDKMDPKNFPIKAITPKRELLEKQFVTKNK